MKKLLLSLMVITATSSVIASDMDTIMCRDMKVVTSVTTLKQVQDHCLIRKQKHDDGMYEVKFVNDANHDTVECMFATDKPNAVVNSCDD